MPEAHNAGIRVSSLARVGLLGLGYFVGAELGQALSLEIQGQTFAIFWPPAGLLLAALVLTRYRLWPVMLLAACAAILTSSVLLHHRSVPVGLGYCVANVGEASIGAWLLRRFIGLPLTLTRIEAVLGFTFWSALISTMFGATIGAGVGKLAFDASYWSAWQRWWAADALGVLIVAPVVLVWAADRLALPRPQPWWIVERAAVFLGIILVTEGVHGELLPPPLRIPAFIMPFLLWAGLRFGLQGATTAILVVALIGVWNTSQVRGPFTALTDNPREQLVRAQATLFVISLSVLALAAIVAERKEAEQQRVRLINELEKALAEIRTLRGLIPICAWCKKIRDDHGLWQCLEDYLLAHSEATLTHGICPECLKKQAMVFEPPGPEAREK